VTSELEVEATGETVGEAKWGALRQLERLHPGLDKGAVRFQVISEGKRGLLGVGYAPARVLATAPDAQTAEPAVREGDSPLAGDVRTVLERITHELGIDCRLELDEGDDTLVAAPGGPVAVSSGATAALATAGTGDVLCGVVATLMAKGIDPFAAAAAGVLAHARAGALAAGRVGADHTVASDVIASLPGAFAR